jgi:calcium/proton exchanger cax
MLVAYASYLFFQLKSQRSLYSPIGEEEETTEDEEDEKEITQGEAIAWLFVLTIWISILSGYLVDAIQGASESLNMPLAFISVILLPIVGNAAEHSSAIMFAMKNKLVSIPCFQPFLQLNSVFFFSPIISCIPQGHYIGCCHRIINTDIYVCGKNI